ncbi:MAG: cytochrome P460 family protein [Gemmatimonadales bacterium]
MRRLLPLLLLLPALTGGEPSRPTPAPPRFTAAGALILPADFDRWVRVGSSIGLGYTPSDESPPGMFHNVALEPAAYAEFRRTGRFPNHTQVALTIYAPSQGVAPARHGWFEGQRVAVEMAVKDTARFAGGWAYFGFGPGTPGSTAQAFPRERCAQCHAAHAARDNVFLQFYPLLRDPPSRLATPPAAR